MTNTITNPYDALYTSLKNQFTVEDNGCGCTVGEYMLAKAGKRNENQSNLPIATTTATQSVVSSVVSFFNSKLTVSAPVAKEKTIKKFPIRTSMSAMLSAVASCALVFSFGIFALTGTKAPSTTDASEQSYNEEFEDVEENEKNVDSKIEVAQC